MGSPAENSQNRRDYDMQLGYVSGKVESVEKEIKELKDSFATHKQETDSNQQEILKEVREIAKSVQMNKEQLSLYRHFWWAAKGILLLAIGFITANWEYLVKFFK